MLENNNGTKVFSQQKFDKFGNLLKNLLKGAAKCDVAFKFNYENFSVKLL